MSIYFLAIATFVLFLSTQVGTPVLPALSAELGADPQAMAGILSASLMTLVLLQFFSGVIADRYGRRSVLVIGAFLGGMTSLLCAFARTWPSLLALRILGGVADAIALPALLGLTAEIAEGRHGTFFGVLRSSQGLSFIVAPAIGGWLSLASLRTPFLIDGLLSLLACVILWRAVRTKPPCTEGHSWEQVLGLGPLFRDPRVRAFALFGAVNNFAFPILAAFLPTKAQQMGYAPWKISLLLALEAVGFASGSLVIGRMSDRLGRKRFVAMAQPIILLACVGLATAQGLPWLALWYTTFGVASSATFLMATTMMADITPSASLATAMGAFDSAIDLVIFIAPLVGVGLYGIVGELDPLLLAAGLLTLLAFPVALRTKETKVSSPLQNTSN